MEEPISMYHKNKESYDKWRVKNQAYINAYYRERRARLKAQKQEEIEKQVIKNFLEKQMNCV